MTPTEAAEMREKVLEILKPTKNMLRIQMRTKDKSGSKWVESFFPWETYELAPSDKTIDALVDLLLNQRSRITAEVQAARKEELELAVIFIKQFNPEAAAGYEKLRLTALRTNPPASAASHEAEVLEARIDELEHVTVCEVGDEIGAWYEPDEGYQKTIPSRLAELRATLRKSEKGEG